ncbi:MAG: carbohydrate ABC transporter substrate-binding protein [Clostridiales bacterium]|nr:carbohydrate ABC transporter substrate-binding protein [Clostridiales bacterium]
MLVGCGSDSKGKDTAKDQGESGSEKVTDSGETTDTSDKGDESSDEKIVLSLYWWGNQTRNDLTQKAIDFYMDQNPNIVIKPEFTDWSGYWDKLAAMTAGGNMPDIIQQDYRYLKQYQESGQIADLTQFIEDGTIDTTNIPDSIIESGSIDGKVYAISLGSNAPMMIYDKGVVEQAGVTIPEQMTVSELFEIGEEIYAKTGVKTYFDGGMNMLPMVARGKGSYLYKELAEGTLDTVLEHFNNVDRFNKSEATITPELLAEKDPDIVETKPIIDGSTWNDFAFSNQYISVSEVAGRELGAIMYPTVDNLVEQPMYLKPSQFFSVAETSKHKEEAAKFINWFTNSIECNVILLGERGIPVSTVVADGIKPKVSKDSAYVFDYIAKVSEVATPIDPSEPIGSGEIEAILKSTVEAIRYGDLTPQDAAKEFVTQAQSILNK